MRGIVILLIALALVGSVTALSSPVTTNGKTYYIVTSTDPTEDTGAEVCAKAGMTCVGYTDTSSATCQQFHPNAATTTSVSGDVSSVYCDGAPQNGVCAGLTDSCHTCPTCSNGVSCTTPVGGLYREMFVECAPGQCSVSIGATTVADFMSQLAGLNTQFQNCPMSLPSGAGVLFKNGVTVVTIQMNNGGTQVFSITITNGKITGLTKGALACQQKITISENDFLTAIQSTSFSQALGYLYGQKKYRVTGCNIISSTRLFFVNLFAPGQVSKNTSPPQPKPAPNCGNIGEDCHNRGCFSGMCGAPRERNSYNQWGYWNYRCIDQRDYSNYCLGHGNTAPAWQCVTNPCS